MTLSPFPANGDPWPCADFVRKELKKTEDLADGILLRGAVKQDPFSGLRHP